MQAYLTNFFQLSSLDCAFAPFPIALKAMPDIGTAVIAVWKQSKRADTARQFVRRSVEEGQRDRRRRRAVAEAVAGAFSPRRPA